MSNISLNRVLWLDIFKGELILMVILTHVSSSAFLNNYFSSFYMPAFFIISGYTMKEKLKVSLPEHLLHKAKILLLPYFFSVFAGLFFRMENHF